MTEYKVQYEQLLKRFINTRTASDELKELVQDMFPEPEPPDQLIEIHAEVTGNIAQTLNPGEQATFFFVANQFLGHVTRIHYVHCTEILGRQNRALEPGNEEYVVNEQALEQARAEAEHSSVSRMNLLAVVSHEIRSPMNALMGITRILSETDLTPEQAEYIDIIRRSGESLLGIINNLLDLSKLDADKMQVERVTFDPVAMVSGVYDLLAVTADEKGLDLVHLFEPEVPSLIESDQQRFMQIVLNLVANGIKFTDEGDVFIHARVSSQHEEDYELEFMVRDSGIGIREDKKDKVFDAYTQADTSHSYSGTGLGLTICKKLVELLQGKIWVESVYGAGSAFFFTIKITAKHQWSKIGETFRHEVFRKKSLLMFDDNRTKLAAAKAQLEQWGLHVDVFDQYDLALAALKTGNYQIAVLDLTVKGRNGIDLAIELQKDEQYKHLPLILYTTTGGLAREEEQYRELFAAVLERPIRYPLLHKVLIETLEGKN